jgi:uncharacterized Zn finger protein
MENENPKISISDIKNWVDPASFSRGQNYYRQDMIIAPRRQGTRIIARCLGSSAPSYQVEATLSSDGIVEAHCSCPVGLGGYCKHVAALLLTWINHPENFDLVEESNAALNERSKEELIYLIQQMLNRYPDLAYLLEIPTPVSPKDQQKQLDTEIIRRQISRAFAEREGDWSWQSFYNIARDLDEVLKLAKQYQENGNIENAAAIYRITAIEILQHENIVMSDEAGRFGMLVDDCVEGLSQCLDSIKEKENRRLIFQTLFNIFLWDTKAGGISIGDRVPSVIFEEALPEEKHPIISQAQAALGGLGEWGQSALGGFLLDLQSDSLDDEAYLEICRKTNRREDLVKRLLELDRVDEAVNEAQKASDYTLLAIADLFVQSGKDSLAEQIIQKRTQTSDDQRLFTWLKDSAARHSNWPQALHISKQLFWHRPYLSEYKEMKKYARQLMQWDELQSETIERLFQEQEFQLLIEIYLSENKIDLALSTLDILKNKKTNWWEHPYSIELKVAKAAQKIYPERSIQIYLDHAQSLIDQRGRGNYSTAATYLRLVRNLYEELGKMEDWQSQIADLRQKNRALPALKDELNKAGL